MSVSLEDVIALEELEDRTRIILPALYGESYEEILPVPMGSAALKYGDDGRVAWDEIWATFCDLALAGGPPHRGTLLEPGLAEEITADPAAYASVVEEICRGVSMVTRLRVRESTRPGWVEVQCRSLGMAGWLARAIGMENVLVRHEGDRLFLPAGPAYRLIKEIKNVVTVTAKTCHYWTEHMPEEQQLTIDRVFSEASHEGFPIESASPEDISRDPAVYWSNVGKLTEEIDRRFGVPAFDRRYFGWVGVECAGVQRAVWLTRTLIVEHVLARREGEVVFLPVSSGPNAAARLARLMKVFGRAYELSLIKTFSIAR